MVKGIFMVVHPQRMQEMKLHICIDLPGWIFFCFFSITHLNDFFFASFYWLYIFDFFDPNFFVVSPKKSVFWALKKCHLQEPPPPVVTFPPLVGARGRREADRRGGGWVG